MDPISSRVLRAELEASGDAASIDSVLCILRQLPLEVFGQVFISMPDSRLPGLSRLLPVMASKEVQIAYTGSSGSALLRQGVAFVEVIRSLWSRHADRPLSSATVLDFGVGYGRLARLMLYDIDPVRLFGCDPWDEPLRLCRDARLPIDLRQSEYLPRQLPYPLEFFDLVYAYSVFTHTSRRATVEAMAALRSVIRPDGMVVLTIRPQQYWESQGTISEEERVRLNQAHASQGFAFRPHGRQPIDGDVTYGDTSMTVAALESLSQGWRVIDQAALKEDPLQQVVCLAPKRPI